MQVGKVKMWIFREKREFFELRTKKESSEFLTGKSEIFSTAIEHFSDRIHDPQTSNPIDAADLGYMLIVKRFQGIGLIL